MNPFLFEDEKGTVIVPRFDGRYFRLPKFIDGNVIDLNEKEDSKLKLERGVEYDYNDLPAQALGIYEVCIKHDSYGDRYISGCYYNAYRCVGDVWMVENDNGKFMLFDREDITFF